MFSSAQSSHVTNWTKDWKRYIESELNETPESLRNRLLEPIRLGDPVFCTALSHELAQSENLPLFIRVLSSITPSKKRILQCEIIFYLCKCSAAENRILSASLIPTLLWMEWLLGGSCGSDKEERFDDDVSAIEIALLATYQQDFHIAPLPTNMRVSPMTMPSIYHNGSTQPDPDFYPWNVIGVTIISNSQLFPAQPLDKFDEPNRIIITYRLCRAVLDYLPGLDQQVMISFALLISRFTMGCTKLDNQEILHQIQTGSLLSTVAGRQRRAPERSSDLYLEVDLLDMQDNDGAVLTDTKLSEIMQNMATLFFPDAMKARKRRFPLTEDLVILWADSLGILNCHFPILEEHVRSNLLMRARSLAFPAAILALSF